MNDPRFPPVGFLADNTPWGHPQYIPGQSAQQRPPAPVVDNSAPGDGFYKSSLPASNVNSFPLMDNTPGGSINGVAAPTTPPAPGMGKPEPIRDAHHYAQMISLAVNVATTSAKFLDQPPTKRNILMLRNNSASANIYVEFGKDATTNSVLRITPNTVILFDVVVPQDDLYAIADAASAVLSFSFSTILG